VITGTRRVSTSPLSNEAKALENPNLPGSFLNVRIPPPEMDPEPPIQVVNVLPTTTPLDSFSIL
jgi:hypothetical protein